MVSAQYRKRFMGGSIRQTSGLASATASILALAIAPPPALSHAIEIDPRPPLRSPGRLGRGGRPRTPAERPFLHGEPSSDAAVHLLPPDGSDPVEIGRTDATGNLSFTLPTDLDGTWEIQVVDGGPGHRDYLEMPVRGSELRPQEVVHHSIGPVTH